MPDTAQVQIINTALAALGQEPVADLGEASLQGSVAAVKLMRHIEAARATVLRRHGWLDALEYVPLGATTIPNYVNWRYPYVYLLPGDAVHVWEIGGVVFNGHESCWGPRWQLGTTQQAGAARKIIRSTTQENPLNVAYVRKCVWGALGEHLADAIAFECAARGAYQVTGDLAKAKAAKAEAEAKVLMAISTEATQEGGQPAWAGSIPAAIRNSSR